MATGDQVGATLALVEQILDDAGFESRSPDDVLAGGADAVLSDRQFGRFIGAFSMQMGCMPYAADDVAGLTVRQFCEHYVAESYPDPPTHPLADDRYELNGPAPVRARFDPIDIPICFVLGCGRSGTTLFRAMLDVHDELWAPGELHLAQFDTMAERAEGAGPFLRNMLVPEVAERFGEPAEQFADRLTGWEQRDVPTTEAYRLLHDADPERLIIDKTPSYSTWPEHLAWISAHFPRATFVHLVRNPSDVIRSLVRIQLHKPVRDMFPPGTNPYHVAEVLWVRNNENIAEARSTIDEKRTLLVRFEDLVTDPEPTLAAVCDLVGVAADARMADPYTNGGTHVASGAGDPSVSRRTSVEQRPVTEPFYPLGERCLALARTYGY